MKIRALGLIAAAWCWAAAAAVPTNQSIRIDGQSRGRTFLGLGALSGGASSRLLIDYPEPQRSQVLDFLFKPSFGASLHHLKVEMGGDTQSTDGTEPSHARTRQEFLHPKPDHYQRGHEWWLMREARQRNRDVYLDVLQCGAPGWIGDAKEAELRKQGLDVAKIDRAKFFSQDNADFIAAFIKGAKSYHGIDIDYCGVWNERPYQSGWIKLLRGTLDREGLSRVKIVAADAVNDWTIVADLANDVNLRRAVGVVGVHYPGYTSPDSAKSLAMPLWASEDGFWGATQDPWQAARILAKIYNRNYIQGRITKTVIWSLVSSYYENLPLPNSGLMKANQPWSGHYEVQPAIWATAHTTQFAQPGWRYLNSACALLPGGGSHVALRNAKGDFSIIAETMDAKASQSVTFHLAGGLEVEQLHVWRTTQRQQFAQLPDVAVQGNSATVTLEPDAIYSFTTTLSQRKGSVEVIPQASDFAMPYHEDFETCQPGRAPKYFSDQGGVFEVTQRADGAGQCLRQVIGAKTIDWSAMEWPVSLVGSKTWTNYEVSLDVRIGVGRVARLLARANRREPIDGNQGTAYALSLGSDGQWNLSTVSTDDVLASGVVAVTPNAWHTLKLRCHGPRITAFVDGTEVARVLGLAFRSGMVGVAAGGWYEADFDNLRVEPVTEPDPVIENLAASATVSASSSWGHEFESTRANDGNLQTRWNAAKGHSTNEWLEMDFGRKVRLDTVRIQQFGARIKKYKVQSLKGNHWNDVVSRERKRQTQWTDTFAPVETRKLRLVVAVVAGLPPEKNTPGIYEIEAYDASSILRNRGNQHSE